MTSIQTLIIGNAISFIAAGFLFAACWTKDRDRTYLYQILEASLLCAANVFFHSWAGISTLLISAVRNTLVLKNRFDTKLMWLFNALVIVVGLAVNNRGLVGLLPILATVQLTICNRYAVKVPAIKWSLLVNTAIWLVYSIFILDISSTLAQIITCGGCIASILRLKKCD